MPRTTFDLDGSVLEELRAAARREKKSLGQTASEVLARAFADKPPAVAPFEWKTHDGGRYLVDILDKDALADALDAE